MTDNYAATAGAYDLFNQGFRPAQVAALTALLAEFRTDRGPVLDLGAGSGLNTALVLDQLPDASVLAIEPSRAMRSLLLAKVAEHPEWHRRVTVRPESFADAPLPTEIAGAVILGVLGHFAEADRRQLFAALVDRLPVGAPVLIDLQLPEEPVRVEPFSFVDLEIGDLTYRGVGEGWPEEGDRMSWRMTYSTLDGDRLIFEEVAEFAYHHPSAQQVRAELAAVGLTMTRVGDGTFWVLRKV